LWAGARRPLTILDLEDHGGGPASEPSVRDPEDYCGSPRSEPYPEDHGGGPASEPFIDLERADAAIELARVKAADADVRIVRAAGYVRVVEDALRKTATSGATRGGGGGGGDFEAELGRARDDLAAAQREKAESEAEQRLAEASRPSMRPSSA